MYFMNIDAMQSNQSKPVLEAHRGVSNEYPENTLSAFRAAAELGYKMIELDTKFTSDNVCVLLHDRTLNRTARNTDGSVLRDEVRISDLTFDEAVKYDYGLHKGESFRGESIPSLTEVLEFGEKTGIPLKFDNVLWSHTDIQREILFSAIEKSNAVCGITCSTAEQISATLARLPDIDIHFDGAVNDETLAKISEVFSNKGLNSSDKLTIWMRFDNKNTSWNKNPPVNSEWAEKVHRIASLGVWLLTEPEELVNARLIGAEIAETDGSLRPKI